MTTLLRPDWHCAAECNKPQHRNVDFFPPNEDGPEAAAAKALCAVCPVRQTCLDEAVVMNERCGIRGGLSTRGRRPLAIAAGTHNFGRWAPKEVS